MIPGITRVTPRPPSAVSNFTDVLSFGGKTLGIRVGYVSRYSKTKTIPLTLREACHEIAGHRRRGEIPCPADTYPWCSTARTPG